MSEKMISIIIPVYNTEKFLEKCIKSIINQDYKNLDIILVDDGSTDTSPTICDEWKKKDSRIQVIHTKNQGVSEARNSGLKIAKGDYISFIDSDDMINKKFYSSMSKIINEKQVDIVMCDFHYIDEVTDKKTKAGIGLTEKLVNKDEIPLLFTEYFIPCPLGYATNKLYKKDIIDGMTFIKDRFIEDMLFNVDVLLKAEKMYIIPDELYCYRETSTSITNTKNREKSIKRFIDFCYSLSYRLTKLKQVMKPEDFSVFLHTFNNYILDLSLGLPKEEKIIAWECFDNNYDLYHSCIKGFKMKIKYFVSRYLKKTFVKWKTLKNSGWKFSVLINSQ